MTLTTRTTRKAPWAVALTALLAVLALVFGVMTMAAPATAKDDPDKTPPGHSTTFVPPGQDDVLPPGQDPGFTPPGQLDDDDDPTNDAKKVHICHADVNNGQGQPNLGQGGTGGQSGTGFNLLYISKAAASNAHFKLHPNDRYATGVEIAQGFCGEPVTPTPGSLCYLPTLTEKTFADVTAVDYLTAKADTTNYAAMPCPVPKTTSDVTYCVATGAGTYARLMFTGTTGTDEAGWLHEGTPLSAYTKVDPTLCITPEEAAAIDAALAEPATVAPVLPGTVEEPETVAVPAPATIPMPATIPAGDGSGTPTVPTALLALLVLGATALAASTVHLVRTTR